MKKQKLKLEQLKVQSFVTSLDDKGSDTINGGATPQFTPVSARRCSEGCTTGCTGGRTNPERCDDDDEPIIQFI